MMPVTSSMLGLTLRRETHQNAFADALLFAAHAFEADKSAADEAERGVFGHLLAHSAGLSVIVLEDDIVVVGQLEEAGRCPLRILNQQGLKGRRRTSENRCKELILSGAVNLVSKSRRPLEVLWRPSPAE